MRRRKSACACATNELVEQRNAHALATRDMQKMLAVLDRLWPLMRQHMPIECGF